jgi:hypothetical protein
VVTVGLRECLSFCSEGVDDDEEISSGGITVVIALLKLKIR